jgi:hypothetical protein
MESGLNPSQQANGPSSLPALFPHSFDNYGTPPKDRKTYGRFLGMIFLGGAQIPQVAGNQQLPDQ